MSTLLFPQFPGDTPDIARLRAKNSTVMRLLVMTLAERRALLEALGVTVHVYKRKHVDPQTGEPLRWAVEADTPSLLARFADLAGEDRRRERGLFAAGGDGGDTTGDGSPSPSDYQNSGKPWSRSTSGPRPAVT